MGLFCYYRSVKVVGVENVPKDAPVLFLSNHQNALMDILLIATNCKRKPWYLTRSDLFKNKIFRPLFQFLQMIPIYRIRDGKTNLSKNHQIFRKCGQLLAEGEAILVFPEANHSLKRRVRPLSKGFTRIIDAALQCNPNLDLTLVPIGQNYQSPRQVGDTAALYVGKPISVHRFKEERPYARTIKKEVFKELKQLTTHIQKETYESVLSKLEDCGVDFTQPTSVNEGMEHRAYEKTPKRTKSNNAIARFLFLWMNLPIVLLWRLWLKPKVPEPEFEATFRFGFSLMVYPLVYLLFLFLISFFYNVKTACLIVIGHAALNLLFTKVFGITSSNQRK